MRKSATRDPSCWPCSWTTGRPTVSLLSTERHASLTDSRQNTRQYGKLYKYITNDLLHKFFTSSDMTGFVFDWPHFLYSLLWQQMSLS